MKTKRHNAKRRVRKNPYPPRYYSGELFTKEETLNYIYKNYNLRILEDSNLQKILSNLESIKYISSGSQSDVFAIQINNKIFLDAANMGFGKAMLFPNKWYAIKLGYVSRGCLNIAKILGKYDLSPKLYYFTNYVIVMDYIDGMTLGDFSKKLQKMDFKKADKIWSYIIIQKNKILDTVSILFGGRSFDIVYSNFLISEQNGKYKVWFIDPCN